MDVPPRYHRLINILSGSSFTGGSIFFLWAAIWLVANPNSHWAGKINLIGAVLYLLGSICFTYATFLSR